MENIEKNFVEQSFLKIRAQFSSACIINIYSSYIFYFQSALEVQKKKKYFRHFFWSIGFLYSVFENNDQDFKLKDIYGFIILE